MKEPCTTDSFLFVSKCNVRQCFSKFLSRDKERVLFVSFTCGWYWQGSTQYPWSRWKRDQIESHILRNSPACGAHGAFQQYSHLYHLPQRYRNRWTWNLRTPELPTEEKDPDESILDMNDVMGERFVWGFREGCITCSHQFFPINKEEIGDKNIQTLRFSNCPQLGWTYCVVV